MSLNRILVAISRGVLRAGVDQALAGMPGLEVFHMRPGNVPQIWKASQRLGPIALITDNCAALGGLRPGMGRCDPQPGLRILVVQLDSNLMQIFDRREVVLQSACDLLQALPVARPPNA